MEFLKELTEINESKSKKRPLKKAAKAVYHRDYVKTKSKPYRKYHKEARTDEGVMDYIGGVGRHAGGKIYKSAVETGRKIAEPFAQAHQAGRLASVQGDIRKLTNTRSQLIQQLVEIGHRIGPDNVKKAINQTFAPTRQINLANTIVRDYLAAAKAGAPSATNEGVWDFLRGAGGAAGGAVKQAGRQAGQAVGGAARQIGDAAMGAAGQVGRSVKQAGQQIRQAGQEASTQADLQRTIQRLGQITLQLYKLGKQM